MSKTENIPGFDSIRPGQNKCGMPEGAPFDEYGVQIGLAGGEWTKGIQDYAEQVGPFPSDSRLRHFVRHGQPPTMSNADAIEVLKHIETDIYGRIAIGKAIDALRNPWVKTADKLPTKEDAWYEDEILTLYQDGETMMLGFDYWLYVTKHPEQYLYWMPIPPLPEVEK
jgi:hypothetical protein